MKDKKINWKKGAPLPEEMYKFFLNLLDSYYYEGADTYEERVATIKGIESVRRNLEHYYPPVSKEESK